MSVELHLCEFHLEQAALANTGGPLFRVLCVQRHW